MESIDEDYLYGDYSNSKRDSVIGHITVYEYGKLFSPVRQRKSPYCWPTERSSGGSEFIDRPKLISKLHHLLHIHRSQRKKSKELNTKCSSQIHQALLKAIRLCFDQNIGESKLYPVGNLFLELFECVGKTTAIFSILLEGLSVNSEVINRDVNVLYPSTSSEEENKRAFDYYLQHVCSCKIDNNSHLPFRDVLNQEMEPFTCLTPLTAAVQKRDPDLIHTLLRYGADPFLGLGDPIFEEKVRDPTEQLVDDLNGLFLFKNTGFNEETKARLAAEEAKVLTCLTYISRSVISIPLTSSNHIVTSFEEEPDESLQEDKQIINKVYNLHPEILENWELKRSKGPSMLQHLCRCAVRASLRSSGNNPMSSIPKCISYLPVPNQIKSYLDLRYD